MSGAARGAEEEVFETPDIAEDDLEQQMISAGPDSTKSANKVIQQTRLFSVYSKLRTQ